MGSTSKVPVALLQWKSIGSRELSGASLSFVYSPLPPSGVQKLSSSSPSFISTSERPPFIAPAILRDTSTSLSEANWPSQRMTLPGVSSTKQSPELSEPATSSTCTARVLSSSVPRTW